MNHLQTIHTEYIRSSRTLETILVSQEAISKIFFVYNYEGISFRVFEDLLNLINFFKNGMETDFHFTTEDDLDQFLAEVEIMPC